jgi:hypothetical protein
LPGCWPYWFSHHGHFDLFLAARGTQAVFLGSIGYPELFRECFDLVATLGEFVYDRGWNAFEVLLSNGTRG